MRGTVVKESLACTDYHLFICATEEVITKTYVMPNNEVHKLLFESGCHSDQKVLDLPYLSGPDSAHKLYLEAWHLLA